MAKTPEEKPATGKVIPFRRPRGAQNRPRKSAARSGKPASPILTTRATLLILSRLGLCGAD